MIDFVWRKRAGSTLVVHAFAANRAVDVPLCGACLDPTPGFREFPPPPAETGSYRRCKRCLAIVPRRP